MPIQISTKKFKDVLEKLTLLAINKSIPITIKLTHEKIYITYDESLMNGTNFDRKKFCKEKPKGLNDEESKSYWRNKHTEHELKLSKGKLDRYLAIDVNPNEIGFVITDSSLKIIDKGAYVITGKVSENKRRFEYSQIVKELFKKVIHYMVSYFIIEDLDNLNRDNYENRVSNRKNKLEFKKEFIFGLVTRRCNETGTILRRVNSCYSSFIGNLTYKEFDSISSSIELCRRGIGQFTKGFKLIPPFDLNNIITDKIDGYGLDLSRFSGFVELFVTIRDKSYRRKDISFSVTKFSRMSHVLLYF